MPIGVDWHGTSDTRILASRGLSLRVARLGLEGFKRVEDQASEGHLVDALALRGDEGRGTLRKAAGRGERPVIRRYPNGATPPAREIPD
jgi:hypothetical protein